MLKDRKNSLRMNFLTLKATIVISFLCIFLLKSVDAQQLKPLKLTLNADLTISSDPDSFSFNFPPTKLIIRNSAGLSIDKIKGIKIFDKDVVISSKNPLYDPHNKEYNYTINSSLYDNYSEEESMKIDITAIINGVEGVYKTTLTIINQEDNTNNTCSTKNIKNYFQENPADFDDDKIVYVYDFNPRGQYKITKVKDKIRLNEAKKKISTCENRLKNSEKEEKGKSSDSIDIAKNIEKQKIKISQINGQLTEAIRDSSAKDKIDQLQLKIKVEDSILQTLLVSAEGLAEQLKQLHEVSNLELENRKNLKTTYESVRDSIANNLNVLRICPLNFNKETLRPRQDLQFKIYHVNRFLCDVSLADILVEFDSKPPKLLSEFLIGDSTGLMGTLINNFPTTSLFATEVQSEVSSLKTELESFFNAYNDIRNEIFKIYYPGDFTCHPDGMEEKANSLFTNLNSIRSNYLAIEDVYNNKQTEYDTAKKDRKECLLYNSEYKSLSESVVTADQEKIRYIDLLNDEKLTDSKKAAINEQIKLLESRQTALELKKDEISKNKYRCDELKDDLLPARIQKLEDCLKPFWAVQKLIEALPNETYIRKILIIYKNMVEQNQSFIVDNINLRRGNRLDLQLEIKTIDTIRTIYSISAYTIHPVNAEIPIIWKPFVSFSSGAFISLGKNLQNKQYGWQAIPEGYSGSNSTKYILTETGYTNLPMGFSAFANVEVKAYSNFGFGCSGGVGLTIEKSPRLGYLGGISLYFGDLRQLALTGGFAAMQVDKLTSDFQAIADNRIISSTNPTITYYKEFKVGGFISLSYTPFVANKGNHKK